MAQGYSLTGPDTASAKPRAFVTAVFLCAQLVFLPAAAAETIPLNGTLTTQAFEDLWPRELSMNVTGPSQSRSGAIVRAAFITELETRGYTIDIAARMDADLAWGGDFENAPAQESRFTLQGEGGNRTAPSLGLNLKLGGSTGGERDFVYILECRVRSASGVLWNGKTVARTQSNDVQKIARALSDQLVSAFGRTVDDEVFSVGLPIR